MKAKWELDFDEYMVARRQYILPQGTRLRVNLRRALTGDEDLADYFYGSQPPAEN